MYDCFSYFPGIPKAFSRIVCKLIGDVGVVVLFEILRIFCWTFIVFALYLFWVFFSFTKSLFISPIISQSMPCSLFLLWQHTLTRGCSLRHRRGSYISSGLFFIHQAVSEPGTDDRQAGRMAIATSKCVIENSMHHTSSSLFSSSRVRNFIGFFSFADDFQSQTGRNHRLFVYKKKITNWILYLFYHVFFGHLSPRI